MNGRVALFVVCVLLLSACGVPRSRDRGDYESLEAEAAAQREAIESVFGDAFGEYETLGTNVDVGPCGEFSADQWSVDSRFIVRPEVGTPEEGVAAMIDVLEERGVAVEVQEPRHANRLPTYTAEIGFWGPMWFWWSSRPEPGIQVGLTGACYSEDRIDAEDPWTLNIEKGIDTLRFE